MANKIFDNLKTVYSRGLTIDSLHSIVELLQDSIVDKEEFRDYSCRSFVMNNKENFPFTLECIDNAVAGKEDSQVKLFKEELKLIFNKIPFEAGDLKINFYDGQQVKYFIHYEDCIWLNILDFSVKKLRGALPIRIYGADSRLDGLHLGYLKLSSDYGFKLDESDFSHRIVTIYGDIYELNFETCFKHYWLNYNETYSLGRFDVDGCRSDILNYYKMLFTHLSTDAIKCFTVEAAKECTKDFAPVVLDILKEASGGLNKLDLF